MDEADTANFCQNHAIAPSGRSRSKGRSLLVGADLSTIWTEGREGRMRRGLKGLIVASFLSFSPFSVHLGLAQSPWADCAAKTSDRIIAGCTRILAGGGEDFPPGSRIDHC